MKKRMFETFFEGPWRNDACLGYAKIAMERARLEPGVIRKVLRAMQMTFDDTSVEEAADQYINGSYV